MILNIFLTWTNSWYINVGHVKGKIKVFFSYRFIYLIKELINIVGSFKRKVIF